MPVLDGAVHSVSEVPDAFDSKYRLTTDQYYRMGESGIFGDDDRRVELIGGEVFFLEAPEVQRLRCGLRLFILLENLLGDWGFTSYKEPVSIVDGTEPQPDILIAKGPQSVYDEKHPAAEDLIVVGDVALNRLVVDRTWKSAIYAGAGIPEYWIVNLVDKQVEVYRKPSDRTYGEVAVYKPGEQVPLTFAGEVFIAVSDFLR
jgi:Uma2 family endonuclease